MNPLKIAQQDTATGLVLQVIGDLDYAEAFKLRELLSTLALRPGQRLVLDLGGMHFCDSSGISALIAARNHALATQADIALVAVPDSTLRVLRIVGLDQIFPMYASSAAAAGL
jgi:anti-anti-sigma factor